MKKRERADDQRTITVSVSKKLVAEIDELAKSENRSRSNWIKTELMERVAEKLARKKIAVLPDVARAAEDSSSSTARQKSETPPPYRVNTPSGEKS